MRPATGGVLARVAAEIREREACFASIGARRHPSNLAEMVATLVHWKLLPCRILVSNDLCGQAHDTMRPGATPGRASRTAALNAFDLPEQTVRVTSGMGSHCGLTNQPGEPDARPAVHGRSSSLLIASCQVGACRVSQEIVFARPIFRVSFIAARWAPS